MNGLASTHVHLWIWCILPANWALPPDISFPFLVSVPFHIDPTSGDLYALESLDREHIPDYSFHIKATDNGPNSLSSLSQVHIFVLDANDHAPEFSNAIQRVQILDNSPPESIVALPKATDQDSGSKSEIRYSLRGLNGSESLFAIDAHSGLVSTAVQFSRDLLTSLDAFIEANGTLPLKVIAQDGGDPPLSGEMLLLLTFVGAGEGVYFERSSYQVSIEEEITVGKWHCFKISLYMYHSYDIHFK